MAQGLYLSQKMALSQVLAPQLQQSLALLQAPTLELKALIEQELANNVVLEEVLTEEVAQEEKQARDKEEGGPTRPSRRRILHSSRDQKNRMVSRWIIFRRRSNA